MSSSLQAIGVVWPVGVVVCLHAAPQVQVQTMDDLIISFAYAMPYHSTYRIALNGTPFHRYRVSLAVWDHTVLPATRHKRTHPDLTPAIRSASSRRH